MTKSLNHEQKRVRREAWLTQIADVLLQIPDDTFAWYLVEKRAILRVLIQVNGNRDHAAQLLQISNRGLYNKLKKYGLRE